MKEIYLNPQTSECEVIEDSQVLLSGSAVREGSLVYHIDEDEQFI